MGISGGRIRLDGKSSRAEKQVRNWNRNEKGTFSSKIVKKDICGREKALEEEKALADKLKGRGRLFKKNSDNTLFHTKP